MFRISQYMQLLAQPAQDPLPPARRPSGPVVIWNLIRRCNLTCKHCYSISADIDFPGELSTAEIYAVMDDLRRFGVPVLILSGGEPLLRPDIFEISTRAREMGFYVGLSTNGTLIDRDNIARIAAVGYDYVGISIDGMRATHDRFRQKAGAFDASLAALRLCRAAGIKVGMRFTPTRDSARELPAILHLMETEDVDKLYVSHLNYGGRGNRHRGADAVHAATRQVMDQLFEAAWADAQAGGRREFVTGNNDADGVYLLHWVARKLPDRYAEMHARLRRWGGNASGVNIANIDNLGNVHPDTFWWNYNLGNVRERPFSAIWPDTRDPLMAGLKATPRPLRGRCAACGYRDVCGGNTRVRAFQLTGDPWWEDPACYLTDRELDIEAADYADARPQPLPLQVRTIRRAG
ncbi:MAG: heme d1 biosynthesis radical SAM protein NirJ [Pseudomonadota bacterium]